MHDAKCLMHSLCIMHFAYFALCVLPCTFCLVHPPLPEDTLSRPEHSPGDRPTPQFEQFRVKQAEKLTSALAEPVRGTASLLRKGAVPQKGVRPLFTMPVNPRQDLFSTREIALAAGVPEEHVRRLAGRRAHVPFQEALRIGHALRLEPLVVSHGIDPIFSNFSPAGSRAQTTRVPLVLSSTLHAGLVAMAVFITTFTTAPAATTLSAERAELTRLIFLVTPGPGGGGGGGGLLQKTPPPKALREGHRALSSPIPGRVPSKPIEPVPAPPEPKPAPLNAESLPVVVAPLISAPADSKNRIGMLDQTTAEADSRGSGRGGGVGVGMGTGVGSGDGSGIGPGSGGGIGGGPYRPGSGIEPPRLLREVKADYTEDARQRRITGDVILEIVVRRDGSVGDVKIVQGLGGGLNDRAVQAVHQWHFAAARRQGAPIDVIVEVAVEFKIR